MVMKKCLGVLMLLGLLFCVSAKAEEMIQVKGSDTMVNLVQSWAESFMGEHPDAFVAVTGGGSGTGIASLLNRTCDIAECSRKMKQEEIELARKKGINPLEWTVALDGLAVVVSAENPVDKLTINQLADIFTGRITNWKEVGGMDSKIVILSREVNSGTHVYFKEHVLRRGNAAHQDEFAVSALLMPSSQAIADEIAQNPQAIGYYGMGYVGSGQKAVAVAKDENSMYILPLIKNVINGEYAISRPLFMYTDGEPQGLVKEFLDFALSNEGQKIVLDLDFVPIKPVE